MITSDLVDLIQADLQTPPPPERREQVKCEACGGKHFDRARYQKRGWFKKEGLVVRCYNCNREELLPSGAVDLKGGYASWNIYWRV